LDVLKVAEEPLTISEGELLALGVGSGFTVTVAEPEGVLEQPLPLVSVRLTKE
jgi:hypothetical protein